MMDPRPPLDTRTVKALSHPMRVKILDHLRTVPEASPNELADAFDASLGVTSYHVRRLRALGFLQLVRRTPRRGALEHHYALAANADTRLRDLARDVRYSAVGCSS